MSDRPTVAREYGHDRVDAPTIPDRRSGRTWIAVTIITLLILATILVIWALQ